MDTEELFFELSFSDIDLDQQIILSPVTSYFGRLVADSSRRNSRDYLYALAAVICSAEEFEAGTRYLRDRGFDPRHIIHFIHWHKLTYQHTALIRGYLGTAFRVNKANGMVIVLRQVLKECWRLGLMTLADYQRAKDIQPIKHEDQVGGREIRDDEVRALFEICKSSNTADIRDAAVFAVLYTSGIRRAELVGLDLSDYDREGGKISVYGKGRKERTVYITNSAMNVLENWIEVRGHENGPLFLKTHRHGTIYNGKRLTNSAVDKILERRKKSAELSGITTHSFRRAFVTNLLEHGIDPITVSKLVGHSSIDTTARYDRRTTDAERQAIALLHIPRLQKSTQEIE